MSTPKNPDAPRLTHAEEHGAVPFDEHMRADKERFDKRREELAENLAKDMAKEIALTVGEIKIDDADIARFVEEETRKIEEKYAELQARQMARIDREEREREERTRAFYDR